ncbi:MAG TPA: DUF2877 domain-containing protein [Burkholderiales bacterium]
MSSPVEWRALRLGRAAAEALASGEPARVFAAFGRSCYVETPAGIACIGDARIGLGPLNVIVATPGAMPPVGTRIRVELRKASRWVPRVRAPERRELTARQMAAWRLGRPSEGLATMLDAPECLAPRACRAAHAFLDWLAAGARDPAPRSAAALIGLGPGLTPAGDDFIGGALIALRAAGRTGMADRAAAWALARARRTNRISAAHLACAACGEGHEALHRLLASLRPRGRGFPAALDALDRIGHTSGRDAAAGALLALQVRHW